MKNVTFTGSTISILDQVFPVVYTISEDQTIFAHVCTIENGEAVSLRIKFAPDSEHHAEALAAAMQAERPDAIFTAQAEHWMEETLDRMEATLDKLGFYQNRFDELGGCEYSSENIKPGYIVRVQRWGECRVTATGPKNFTFLILRSSGALTAPYAEIETIIQATEAKPDKHPFKVGDTFTCHRWNSAKREAEKLEYRIIRATDKSVTLQTGDEKPFVRKPAQVTWDHSGKWRLSITDWNDGTVYRLPEA